MSCAHTLQKEVGCNQLTAWSWWFISSAIFKIYTLSSRCVAFNHGLPPLQLSTRMRDRCDKLLYRFRQSHCSLWCCL